MKQKSLIKSLNKTKNILNKSGEKNISSFIKLSVWSRNSTIFPIFVGQIIEIHDGKKFNKIRIVPEMIGHKFGEFCLTRKHQIKMSSKK